MEMHEKAWKSMEKHGNAGQCMKMHGKCMKKHEKAWECMGMHGDKVRSVHRNKDREGNDKSSNIIFANVIYCTKIL